MVADSCVFDSLKRLGVAGRPLDKNEERDVGKLAECGKLLMQEAVYDLLKKSQHKPVLFEYSGDATPLKLKHAFQVAFGHARSGYAGVELYCQGAFVRSIDASGQPVVQALLKEPRPMSGKGAIESFNGLVELSQHLTRWTMKGSTFTITVGMVLCILPAQLWLANITLLCFVSL